MDKKVDNRFRALDGLRGLAIILVLLNHINPQYIVSAFPFLDWIGLFSSGVTGVSFLFVLSGFLMAYLYPQPKDGLAFLQKRYTRIFPLFLSMCAFMFFFSLFSKLSWYEYIFVLFAIAIAVHCIWVYGIQKIRKQHFSRILFFLFLGLQVGVGILYAFWIMRKPAIYFGQILPPLTREGFIGLVNATLTFPLGNYIPMLDGVYWSLASEILFYVLYPFIIVPLVWLLVAKKRTIKIFFLLSLIPFLAAVDILSRHLFVLSTLQFSLFYYFATGIALAYLYKKYKSFFAGIPDVLSKNLSILLVIVFFLTIIVIHLLDSFTTSDAGPWIRLLFAIPLTCLIAVALNTKTSIGKFLSNKFLVFIGSISYSIYLSHAAVIHIITSILPATNILSNTIVLILCIIVSIVVSWCLYILLEKPYFLSPHRKIIEVLKAQQFTIARAKLVLVSIIGICIISIFFAFQSHFNFFSEVIDSPTEVILPIHATKIISTKNDPYIIMQFTAEDNNLGIIAVKIAHLQTQKIPLTPMFTFRLTDPATGKVIFSSDYVLDEFHGEDFPFGFPAIQNAKNKTFCIDFILHPPSAGDFVTVDTDSVKTIYQLQREILSKILLLFLSFW